MKTLHHALVLTAAVSVAAGCGNKSEPAPGSEPKPEPAKTSVAAPIKPAGGDTGVAMPTPAPAHVDPGAMGPDGLPAVIPPPGSTPPTVAEWNAVTKEVTIKGSSALGCETKMLREWLRVSCHQKGSLTPTNVKTENSG